MGTAEQTKEGSMRALLLGSVSLTAFLEGVGSLRPQLEGASNFRPALLGSAHFGIERVGAGGELGNILTEEADFLVTEASENLLLDG